MQLRWEKGKQAWFGQRSLLSSYHERGEDVCAFFWASKKVTARASVAGIRPRQLSQARE